MVINSSELLTLEYLSRKYDETNVPLYISYPTSGYWKCGATDEDYMQSLKTVKHPFLYLHFPFCENVCHYCMCYKVPNLSENERERYLDCLEVELKMKSEPLLIEDGDATTQMHWGGGTPTCMKPDEMERVFKTVEKNYPLYGMKNGNCSIEAFPKPATVTEEKLSLLSALGFNEISFGVQDLDERVQHAINRSSNFNELATVMERSRKYGLRVHIDLCYGLPFQEIDGFERTIRDVLTLRPDRVAMLTYVHYPLLYPNQRNIPAMSIPNSFMRVLLSRHAEELFRDAGYEKIGFDHYVLSDNSLATAYKNGTVNRDLMGYSVSERKDLVGFGSSAISFLGGAYYHNAMTVDQYDSFIEEQHLPLHEGNAYFMNDDDRIRNEIIQKCILTDFRIDIKTIEKKYTVSFAEYFARELLHLKRLEKDDLVSMNDPEIITVTSTGKFFSRHVAAVFDRYHTSKK